MQRIANLYNSYIRRNPFVISSIFKWYVRSSFLKNMPQILVILRTPEYSLRAGSIESITRSRAPLLAFTLAGLMKFLGLSKEEDSELIQILKHAEKEMLKKEYNISEQLFHVALKIAQDLQNEEAIIYIYDRLANVAFETGQNEKARKLFIDVVQRLIDKGMAEDDVVLIHLSFKLAKIFENIGNYKNAELGYQYCIDSLKPKLTEENPDYNDVLELWLTILTGYAYFYYNRNNLDEALKWFQLAYDTCVQIHGLKHEKTILLLNNLGSVHRRKGNLDDALTFFHNAEELGKHFPEMEEYAFVYLNLAYLYMENKMYDVAKNYCKRALVNSSRMENENNKKEAEECLNEVAKTLNQVNA